MSDRFKSTSVTQTESIAGELAALLQPNDCIALDGELGAGKTQFVRGLVKALGGDGRTVSSPTFILLNVYDTPRPKVFHLDAYRASGSDELESVGFTELLTQGGIVVVEWAKRIESLLPASYWTVQITPTGKRSRAIEIARIDARIVR